MAQCYVALPGHCLPPRRLQTDPHYHLRTTLPLSKHLTPTPPSSPNITSNLSSNLVEYNPYTPTYPSTQLSPKYSYPDAENPFAHSSNPQSSKDLSDHAMASSKRTLAKVTRTGTRETSLSRQTRTTRKTQAKAARYCTMDSPYTQQTWNWIQDHQNMPSRLKMSTGYDFTFPTASYYDRNNPPFMPDSELLKVDGQEEFAWVNGLPLHPQISPNFVDNDSHGESFPTAQAITPFGWQDDDEDWYLRPSRFELENGFNFNEPPAISAVSSSPIMPLVKQETVQRNQVLQPSSYQPNSNQQSSHEIITHGSYGSDNQQSSVNFHHAAPMSLPFHPAARFNMSIHNMKFPNYSDNNNMMRPARQATFNAQNSNQAAPASNMMRSVRPKLSTEHTSNNGQEFGRPILPSSIGAAIPAVATELTATQNLMNINSAGEPSPSEQWLEGFDDMAAFFNESAKNMDLDTTPANQSNTIDLAAKSLPVDPQLLETALHAVSSNQNDSDTKYLFEDWRYPTTSASNSPPPNRVPTLLTNTGTSSSSLQTPVQNTPTDNDALPVLACAGADWDDLFANMEEDNIRFLDDFSTML